MPLIRRISLLLLFLPIFAAGCAVGPDFVLPEPPVPERWVHEDDPSISKAPVYAESWWQVFDDPILGELIEETFRENLSLRTAGLRILEARASLGIATGNLYPQEQVLRGGLTAVHGSEHGANTLGGDLNFSELDFGADIFWELDFWGRFRRAVQSETANLAATVADYDDILVVLTAETARTYVLIRTFEERLRIAEKNVKIQGRSLDIADVNFKAGQVSELDYQQALSLMRDTQASIPRLLSELRRSKNTLAVLLGTTPDVIDEIITEDRPIPLAPPDVAVDVPADLLRRRPDIRRAEFAMAAQSALIGVAKADLYPAFSLFGSIGFVASDSAPTKAGGVDGSNYGDLFGLDALQVSAGPSFNWNFLNYGRIKNTVRVQDARFQQTVSDYEDTVLRAYREVEDALTGFLRSREESAFLEESVKAGRRSVDISLLQYREGLVDFQRVLDSQRELAAQEDRLVESKGSIAVNLIDVYRALGGGWQIRKDKDILPEEIKAAMRERSDWGGLLNESKETEKHGRGSGKDISSPDW